MIQNTLCELIDHKEFEAIILKYMAKLMLLMCCKETGWRPIEKLLGLVKKLIIDEEMVMSNDFSKKHVIN